MSLPDRERAKHWVDRVVVDTEGTELGTCARVYADLETGAPEWLLVSRADQHRAVVPLLNAAEIGDRVQVQVTAGQVASAPSPAGEDRLSTEEETALYQHYGVEFSDSTSPSVLPSEVTEADVPAGSEIPAPAPAPVPAPAQARRPEPTTPPSDRTPAPAAGKSKSAVLPAALAAILGVLLARRRLLARRSSAPKKAVRRAGRRAAKARAKAARGMTPAQVAAKAAAARAAAASNVTAARTVAATNVSAARTAAANLAATKAATATNLAKTKAAPAARTKAAAAARTAAAQAAAVGSGGVTVGKLGAHVAGGSVRLGARGAAGAGRSGRTLARKRRERRRNRKVALRAIKSTGGNVTAGATRARKRGRSTMGKIKTGLTLGAGYVLGARAGRERYEQLRRASATVAQRPEVQRTTQKVTGVVAAKLPPAVASKLPLGASARMPSKPPTAPPHPPSSY